MLFYLPLLLLFSYTSALYSSSDDVIEITSSTFDQVLSSDSLWFVEFYAPWCGHCQNLAPEWKKAATILKGIVKIGAIDADKHKDLVSRYNVPGFPTIKVFGHDKQSAKDYNGGRSASEIVSEALSQVKSIVNLRQGGSSQSRSGSTDDAVIELTSSNFEETVLKSTDYWLVEFFAPWCGHCKNLKPHWERAASELKGKVKLGAVDATVHSDLAQKYNVRGYPTIKFWSTGEKRDPIDYTAGRTSDEIIKWALDIVSESLPPPKVAEVTSADVLTTTCNDKQLCIISALPELLDCQSTCRNEYLELLQEMAIKYKNHNWGWMWAEANSQKLIEKALDVGGFGYPAMVAINVRKQKFASLRGSFSKPGINEFLRDLSLGRGSVPLRELKEIPEIIPHEPWDGKDAQVFSEDEIDLAELGIKTEL